MKIGILIDRLNVGGVEKTAIQEVIAMKKLGKDVSLLVLSRKAVVKGAHEDLLERVSVEYLDDKLPKVLRFSFKFPVFAFFSFFHVSYALLLPIFVKKSDYDYIVSHGSYTTITALLLKWFRGIPYSTYFWDPISYIVPRVYKDKLPGLVLKLFVVFAKSLDKLLVRNADVIFTAGDTHNEYFVNECGCSEEKIIVVNPGTPLGKPISEKQGHVLMVTTWKAGKHPEYVFEIIREVPKVKIKMVGGWIGKSMLERFRREMKRLGFDKNIELFGEANEEQLAKLYPKALVHLTTNLEKGFGMPTLEAAACGTTFIVPLGSGVCSVFEDTVDGFFTEEKNTKEIASKISLLMNDEKKAIEMGLSAYNKVKEGFSWEAHAKKISDKISSFS